MRLCNFIKNPFIFLKGERDYRFDLMKLWALLSVVLDHSLQRWVENSRLTQLYNFIFLSQMPIFIFVSGFFAFNQIKKLNSFSKKELLLLFVRKILSLLIPFISYSIIKSFIFNDYSTIYLSFIYPQKSLWFLWTLMWLEILMLTSQLLSKSLLIKFTSEIKWVFLSSFIIFIFLLSPVFCMFLLKPELFDSKLIIYYSLFFAFGYAFNYILNNRKLLNGVISQITMGCLSTVTLVIVMITHPVVINDSETIINMVIRILGSVSSILIIFEMCSFLSKLVFFKTISKFGRLSLEFYYVHLLLLLIPVLKNYQTNIFVFICLYFLLLITSFTAIMILKACVFTDFICFGKIRSIQKGKTNNV